MQRNDASRQLSLFDSGSHSGSATSSEQARRAAEEAEIAAVIARSDAEELAYGEQEQARARAMGKFANALKEAAQHPADSAARERALSDFVQLPEETSPQNEVLDRNEFDAPFRDLPPRHIVMEKAAKLARVLSVNLGMPVRLAVTDNRSTMVSFRRASASLRLRLHHMFLDAPEGVIRAIADYAGRGHRRAGTLLDDYIKQQQPLIRRDRSGRGESELEPRGRCYDLQALFEKLNETHFQGGIQARIGWGRSTSTKRRRRSIRLGVYDHQTREIRVHPALDRPDVPMFFVEFIVFHEMLHQLFPSPPGSSRRIHHPRAFRDREKAFPLYASAIRWEKANLGWLLKA